MAQLPETKRARARFRGVRFATLGISVIGVVLFVFPVGMGLLAFSGLTHPFCGAAASPADYGLIPQEVVIPAAEGPFPGYFFAGSNGATIIVPPAFGASRGGLLHEVAILNRHGYSVLTYDSRQCVGPGAHSLGLWEADDIHDAVGYLRSRTDVDMTRLGLHGFSQAGASAVFAAAEIPEILAVVAEGGYVDYGAQALGLGKQNGVIMVLFNVGARVGYWMNTGHQLEQLSLANSVARIAPRRVLLVYGEYEMTLAGARDTATTGDHVSLWEVSGATHGSYVASAGADVFAANVVGFFDNALLVNPPGL